MVAHTMTSTQKRQDVLLDLDEDTGNPGPSSVSLIVANAAHYVGGVSMVSHRSPNLYRSGQNLGTMVGCTQFRLSEDKRHDISMGSHYQPLHCIPRAFLSTSFLSHLQQFSPVQEASALAHMTHQLMDPLMEDNVSLASSSRSINKTKRTISETEPSSSNLVNEKKRKFSEIEPQASQLQVEGNKTKVLKYCVSSEAQEVPPPSPTYSPSPFVAITSIDSHHVSSPSHSFNLLPSTSAHQILSLPIDQCSSSESKNVSSSSIVLPPNFQELTSMVSHCPPFQEECTVMPSTFSHQVSGSPLNTAEDSSLPASMITYQSTCGLAQDYSASISSNQSISSPVHKELPHTTMTNHKVSSSSAENQVLPASLVTYHSHSSSVQDEQASMITYHYISSPVRVKPLPTSMISYQKSPSSAQDHLLPTSRITYQTLSSSAQDNPSSRITYQSLSSTVPVNQQIINPHTLTVDENLLPTSMLTHWIRFSPDHCAEQGFPESSHTSFLSHSDLMHEVGRHSFVAHVAGEMQEVRELSLVAHTVGEMQEVEGLSLVAHMAGGPDERLQGELQDNKVSFLSHQTISFLGIEDDMDDSNKRKRKLTETISPCGKSVGSTTIERKRLRYCATLKLRDLESHHRSDSQSSDYDRCHVPLHFITSMLSHHIPHHNVSCQLSSASSHQLHSVAARQLPDDQISSSLLSHQAGPELSSPTTSHSVSPVGVLYVRGGVQHVSMTCYPTSSSSFYTLVSHMVYNVRQHSRPSVITKNIRVIPKRPREESNSTREVKRSKTNTEYFDVTSNQQLSKPNHAVRKRHRDQDIDHDILPPPKRLRMCVPDLETLPSLTFNRLPLLCTNWPVVLYSENNLFKRVLDH